MKKWIMAQLAALFFLIAFQVWAATIDEVTFLSRIQPYEAVVDTVLITQEGKRIPIAYGTRLNVAGFTATEAFVISRKDSPNGFVRKSDVAPLRRGY